VVGTIEERLDELGVDFRKTAIDRYVVYFSLSRSVFPEDRSFRTVGWIGRCNPGYDTSRSDRRSVCD